MPLETNTTPLVSDFEVPSVELGATAFRRISSFSVREMWSCSCSMRLVGAGETTTIFGCVDAGVTVVMREALAEAVTANETHKAPMVASVLRVAGVSEGTFELGGFSCEREAVGVTRRLRIGWRTERVMEGDRLEGFSVAVFRW